MNVLYMKWHDFIPVALRRVGYGCMMVVNSPFLVNFGELENGTTSKIKIHGCIKRKLIIDHVCWA